MSENDPHVCEDENDQAFCPYVLYLPESELYQCRTSPGSYLIVTNETIVPKFLDTVCPDGQALKTGTRECEELTSSLKESVLVSPLFSTKDKLVYEKVGECPEGTFKNATKIRGWTGVDVDIINCTKICEED